jgi:xylan 1,4-beta-xylosidase
MPEEVDALATFNGRDCVSVLVWRHADDQYAPDPGARDIALTVERLPFGGPVRVRHWRIDEHHSNSHAAWQAIGRPQDPSEGQLRAIKERQGLEMLEPDREAAVAGGRMVMTVTLPLPSVSLLEIRPAG